MSTCVTSSTCILPLQYRECLYILVYVYHIVMLQELLMETTPQKHLTRSNSRCLNRALRPLRPSPPLSRQHKQSDTMKSRSLGGTLRGTLRAKLASQLHKSVMKGQQDYSLPRAAVTSQLQYQFMAALERDLKGHRDTSSQRVTLGWSYDQFNEFDK